MPFPCVQLRFAPASELKLPMALPSSFGQIVGYTHEAGKQITTLLELMSDLI